MSRSRVVTFIAKEVREILPPTLFFLISFNLVWLTTQLILDDYKVRMASFLLATTAALVVGKAVLVANRLPFLRRFDHLPLVRPVLFKTIVYWAVTAAVRFIEQLIEYGLDGGTLSDLPHYLGEHFSWHRFAAVQIWVFVLFLIYTFASELDAALGEGTLARALFVRRPSSFSG